MERPRSFITRWAAREFEIRLLCARDPTFRAILEDYEEAAAAQAHWAEVAGPGDRRTADFQDMAEELEREFLARLGPGTG